MSTPASEIRRREWCLGIPPVLPKYTPAPVQVGTTFLVGDYSSAMRHCMCPILMGLRAQRRKRRSDREAQVVNIRILVFQHNAGRTNVYLTAIHSGLVCNQGYVRVRCAFAVFCLVYTSYELRRKTCKRAGSLYTETGSLTTCFFLPSDGHTDTQT